MLYRRSRAPAYRHASPLRVECLESRDVPAFLTSAEVVVGADAGSPSLVRLIDPSTQTVQSQFLAFGTNFYGGVRVAVGDVNGDGYPDLVAAAGPGGGPQIKVYDGMSGNVLSAFFAFPANFTGGVNIATADVDGDGRAEVIAGAGAGGGPQVSVFNGVTGSLRASLFAYGMSFQGGVRVAGGDLDGDGKAEVITAPGVTGGPAVQTYAFIPATGTLQQTGGILAFTPSFRGGMYVAAGDVNGDGKAEIVTGAGAGGGPAVGVFTGSGSQLASFFAYATSFQGGVRVSAADLTGDGVADVITAPGPGGGAQVNIYSLPTGTTPVTNLFGFPANQATGVFVAGSGKPLLIPATPDSEIATAYGTLQSLQRAGRSVVPVVIPVRVPVGGYFPYWFGPGFGSGLGMFGLGMFGPWYYDAPGLYAPLTTFYGPSFFGPAFFGDPGFVPNPFYGDPNFGLPGVGVPDFGAEPGDLPVNGNIGDFGGSDFGDFGDFGGGDFGGGDFGDFGDFGGGDFGGFGDF